MHIPKITVTYGRSLQLGPRDEAHIEITLEAQADTGEQIVGEEEIRAAAGTLWEQARAEVRRRGEELRAGREHGAR